MVMSLREIEAGVAAYAAAFDPAVVSPSDAELVVAHASKTINMLETVRALAAARAAQGGSWRRDGAASPAHDLARKTGTTVTKAKEALDAGEKLAELPALDAAARAGELSPAQVAPIADAASAAPDAEERLVNKAKRASVGELRDECARTKAAAEPDDDARHQAIRRSRHLRKRRCADGAGELTYRSTLDEVAEIYAIAQGFANRAFDVARIEGRHEPEEAYLADGLLDACRAATGDGDADTHTTAADATQRDVAASAHPTAADRADLFSDDADDDEADEADADADDAATGAAADLPATVADDAATGADPSAPAAPAAPAAPSAPAAGKRVRKTTPTKIVVRIDWDALLRGWPIDDEVCEIAGIGPIPVSVVRAMMASGDPFLAGIVTNGVDVANVFHLGRKPTAYHDTALDWTAPTCTTEGCNRAARLETDHREDWAHTKVTLFRWLERHCHACHAKKTRHGWALVNGTGKRPLVPPHDPRHPRHQSQRQPRAG